MLKRFELYNHTTQSDASITCRKLADIMVRDHTDVFALTDHNTISGHAIMKSCFPNKNTPYSACTGWN